MTWFKREVPNAGQSKLRLIAPFISPALGTSLIYSTVQQARERYKLSHTMLMKIATESGAIRRFGRSVRIDIETLDNAVNENYRGGDDV